MANKEKTKRQAQAIRRKDKLFATAVKLFYMYGYDSVTIEQICTEAGVSKGLFYNYFASKDEIFMIMFNEVEDVYRDIRASFVPGETAMERLLDCTERIALHVMSNELRYESLRIVYIRTLKQETSMLTNQDREFFLTMREIIEYGQHRGEIRADLPMEQILNYITSHLFGCYFLSVANDQFDLLKEIKTHVSLIIKGISTKP